MLEKKSFPEALPEIAPSLEKNSVQEEIPPSQNQPVIDLPSTPLIDKRSFASSLLV